jgi:hypothetical protein
VTRGPLNKRRFEKMPEKKQKANSFFKRILPYMVGAFIFFILLRIFRGGFSFENITEILIELGILVALILVYALGYIIVIIYEKFERKRKA